ncbi:hypothetical protein [Labilibaculum manganireducens]|uniref:hypothetical protein n=1 Tax=Labilibaculum manganireducens TaxID=1940525 RepID=UPI0029F48CF6|nr:hypothetical protein [Labilibaculum manganireducens]
MNKKILLVFFLILTANVNYGKVFIPQNGIFIERNLNIEKENINSICKQLGFNTDQCYSYFNFDGGDKDIISVIFKVFTDEIVFVWTSDEVELLSAERMSKYLSKFDLKKEFDSYDIESTLNDGVKNKSLTSSFLSDIFNLKDPGLNGTLHVLSIGYDIEFKQGLIHKFYSADGLNKWAKLWKNENKAFYDLYLKAATKYWGDQKEKIINEINIQADAYANAPKSEYLEYHRTAEGTVNFKMLLVAHYNEPMTLNEFKEVNHGRYELSNEFNTKDGYKRTIYKLNKTLYTFSEKGILINSYTAN